MTENNFFIEIETERLGLRRLKKSDWKMVSFLRSDKTVNKLVKRPSAETKEKALSFIAKIDTGVDKEDLYYWKITEKNKDEMIGSICLWNFSSDRKVAEIGYDLSPDYQGRGIMNESLENVLDFGFQKLSLDSIEAYTHNLNESSRKLLERNGFNLVEGKKDEDNENNVIYELKKPATSTL